MTCWFLLTGSTTSLKVITSHGLMLALVLAAENMAIDSSVKSSHDVSPAVQTSDTLNKSWKNDKSKFGFKMLQKMGWTEGKGLGKNEDGMAEHVKVAKKSNNLGLGAKSNSTGSDSWASTAISFNGVLEALGKAYGSTATRKNSRNDSTGSTRSSASSKQRQKDKKCSKKDDTDSADTDSKKGSSSGSESVSAAQAASHCPSRAKRIRSKDVKAFSSADLRAILGQAAPASDSPSAAVAGSNLVEEDTRTTKSSKKKKKAKLRGKDKGGSSRGDSDADDDDASPRRRPRTRSMDLVETEVATSAAKRRRTEGMERGGSGRPEVGGREQGEGAREDRMSTESLSLESDRKDKKDKKKSKKRRKEARELGRAGAVAGKVERDERTTMAAAGEEKKRRKKKKSTSDA